MSVRSASRSTWGVLALTALLVLDIVLVGMALRGRDGLPATSAGPAPTSTPAPNSTPTPNSTSDPTSTTTPTGTSTPGQSGTAAPRVALEAVSADVAWRVRSPSCAGSGAGPASRASVDVTRDGGRVWTSIAVPDDVVARLRPRSATRAFVVSAAASDCRPGYRATSGSGWSSASGASAAWFRVPADPAQVHAPGDRLSRPCPRGGAVVDLVVFDLRQAAVLCASADVLRTDDSGGAWRLVAAVPGALALAAGSGRTLEAAAVGVRGCAGVAVVQAAAPPGLLVCVAGAAAPPGEVDLSVAGSTRWLLAGGRVYRGTGQVLAPQ